MSEKAKDKNLTQRREEDKKGRKRIYQNIALRLSHFGVFALSLFIYVLLRREVVLPTKCYPQLPIDIPFRAFLCSSPFNFCHVFVTFDEYKMKIVILV